jgi:hypothetical protein
VDRQIGVKARFSRLDAATARVCERIALAAAVAGLVSGCGTQGPDSGIRQDTGVIIGRVQLGPQCPVQVQGRPCDDKPAVGAPVVISQRLPGEAQAAGPEIARTTTDATGHFHIEVAAGAYVATAAAGMYCQLTYVTVTAGQDARTEIPCDTGIR